MKTRWGWLPVLLLLAPLGCGQGEKVKVEPVGGTVTLDGAPLANATVTFIPTGETPGTGAPPALTGADGTYRLVPGAAAGTYRVVISRWVRPDGSLPPPDVPPIESDARETLPFHYSDPDRSMLTATVPEGGGTIDFPLQSKRR